MKSPRLLFFILVIAIVGSGLLFVVRGRRAPARPIGVPISINAPLGLPPVPVPADNPPTAETIALGRRLYYDPVLSVDNSTSCASCHAPAAGFADPRKVSVGVGGKVGTRNSPPVANAAYYVTQFWDGRERTLEKQAEGPVTNPVEMAHTLKGVEEVLNRDPSYREDFAKAFGPGRITYNMVEKAIASFERTVLMANSPFDRWFYGHDEQAISESAKRGFEVFRRVDKGNCASCHTFNETDALFTDNQFHNIGVGVRDESPTDLGRYEVTKVDADRGAFKTPTMRNIALTAPYMHDGSLRTLKEVVDFYVGGGNSNPFLDPKIKALDFLTGQERADLVAFMVSLTGEMPANSGPPAAKEAEKKAQDAAQKNQQAGK
ncbi:MAG TPA: cytochrome c peroxidase [Terriglobales bacterium]|nr:cytochrome c peroxidase [Terriglobales bacterium]